VHWLDGPGSVRLFVEREHSSGRAEKKQVDQLWCFDRFKEYRTVTEFELGPAKGKCGLFVSVQGGRQGIKWSVQV
jgi:hypothetical protein